MRAKSVHHYVLWALIQGMLVFGAGCSWFKQADGLADVTKIPLTPVLRLAPTVTDAAIPYQDACGQPAALAVAAPLSEGIAKKFARVFKGVTPEVGSGSRTYSDGVVEVALGLKQIDLAIHRQVNKRYPVTVTLGLDVAFLADDGTVLFSKKLQSAGLGEVEVTEQACDAKGLNSVAQEAINLVTEGIAKQLAESVRVREFAERRKSGAAQVPIQPDQQGVGLRGDTTATASVPAGSSVIRQEMQEPAPRVSDTQPEIPKGGGQDAALTFRAIIRDENRDQMLQPEESFTIEVEVKNEGIVEARDVEVTMTGTPALVELFPPVLSLGTLQPGEIKRAASTQQVTGVKEPLQGDLLLSVRSATPIQTIPLAKRFTVLMKADKVATDPPADVDQPPKPFGALKQPKALVIAIGVGRFRDEQVPAMTYAAGDAAMMAKYLRTIAGIPEDRVRLLVDGRALKQDLAETFDEWLPKRADASTILYLFFAGRGLVDGTTGSVSLVPFDGTTSNANRLYSIRRVQEALSRAAIQRAILMFDVSLEPAPGADPARVALPNWDAAGGERNDQLMWMVSHKGLQEAHVYEQAKHGLFTYHLLHGLQGIADIDRDGTVAAGELCLYVRGQVNRVARQFGNEQDPLCLPPPGQGAMVRIHPMAKGNNPKPTASVKKEEKGEPAQNPVSGVGPGQ